MLPDLKLFERCGVIMSLISEKQEKKRFGVGSYYSKSTPEKGFWQNLELR